jgi:exodeoxyribonuclease V beta subunit
VDHFDLDRHLVVEAAAGTGKTYTLEHLVRRLLLEKRVSLDQILLVTYTEKATGELKGRLRANLEDALKNLPDHKDLFQEAIDHFDQAHITTIHGFCQRILQEYPFEQGQDFQAKLVDDLQLLPSCLREVQRKNWPQEYGHGLRTILDLAGYQGKDRRGWEDRVLDIAGKFRPACGHQILPLAHAGWQEQIPILEAKLAEGFVRARRAAGFIPAVGSIRTNPAARMNQHPWIAGYDQISQSKLHTRRRETLLAILRVLAQSHDRSLADFLRLQEIMAGKPFTSLHDKIPKKDRLHFEKNCPQLAETLADLENLRLEIERLAPESRLLVSTVHEMQDHLAQSKRERGLRSYEDMLALVNQGLDPKSNPGAETLAEHLRNRFRYAIVDEFQDTDPLQWRIFRRLFVAGGESRLFLVGDPKQAIFGFRGADLPTYLRAVNELRKDYHADFQPLTTNWRSCPELLKALNQLFKEGNWFPGDDICYRPVEAPSEEDQPNKLVSDQSGLAALSLVDLTHLSKLKDARKHYARFVAGEIRRLLGDVDKSLMEICLKSQKRRFLDAGDMAILFFTHAEAKPIIRALRDEGIPYSYYKQRGLWRSEEAMHLGYLLRALARPDNYQEFHKALLTPFFGFGPEDLACGADLPPRHPARELFLDWVALAQQRSWASLFQAVLEKTGILFGRAGSVSDRSEDADLERRLANYRHILQTLAQAAYEQNLDLDSILDVLHGNRLKGDDKDFQPIETERPKVRIMTVHSAKGLEFPVVFLAGGFTDKPNNQCLTYRDNMGNVVFDLAPGEEAKEKAKRERTDEQRRLLYVALTRAMFKVVTPWVNKGHSPGPLVTIFSPAVKEGCLEELGRPYVGILHPERGAQERGSAEARRVLLCSRAPALEAPAELFPRLDADLHRRRIFIRSFSSLHRQTQPRPEEASYIERPPRGDDDVPDSLVVQEPLRGPVFGDMVHAVLETLDFSSIGQAADAEALICEGTPFRKSVDEQLTRNLMKLQSRVSGPQLEEACRLQIANLVWNTLRTPLAEVGPLWQIPTKDRLHEVEFHFPEIFEASGGVDPHRLPLENPPEIRSQEGFLTGFMDLVFRKNGRFFLVDWKTNLLESYAPQDIARAMSDCDYVRQYRLYLQALARWLERQGLDFARDFGGVFYLFLRGMNGRDDSSGVFFHKPAEADLNLELVLA